MTSTEDTETVSHYTYIWEFRVLPDRLSEFVRHYEGAGTWAQLFRRAPGYRGTRLLRDQMDPLRFLTIDDWVSEEHYRAFRERCSDEYEALDRTCAVLTSAESAVGRFNSASPQVQDRES